MDSTDCFKDLGILFDTGLKFQQHASEQRLKKSSFNLKLAIAFILRR